MSLIDEALKRAQSAAQGGPEQSGDRPWVPTPMPDAGLKRGSRARRAGGVGLLVIAAAGGVYLSQRRRPSEVSVSAARNPAQSVAPTAARTPAAAPTAFPLSIVPTPPRARPQTALSTTPPATRGQTEAAAPARSHLVPGKTYPGVIELPEGARIELGGIVWSEAEPRALVNDRVVGVGAYVEGFTVSRIETDRVELQKDGVTIFLTMP